MSGSGETISLRQDNALTEVRLLFYDKYVKKY